MKQLLEKASTILGRDAEVEKTKDGKYIVLFMSLTTSPPPKGDTPEDALEKFVNWYEDLNIEVAPNLDVLDEDDKPESI